MTKAKTATKKQTAEERAYYRLLALIDKAHIARAQASWTNGYRAAKYGGRLDDDAEAKRLYRKELAQWELCEPAEVAVDRAIRAYGRAVAGVRTPRKR